MKGLLPFLSTFCATVVAGVILYAWLSREAPAPEIRHAEKEGSQAEMKAQASAKITDLRGCFKRFPEIRTGESAGTWMSFRGDLRDNIATNTGSLLTTWPETGPRVVWQIPVGDGHAMPAVSDGCLYLLDYDEARGGDALKCLNADTGELRWEHLYAVKAKRNHGISRTVPAIGAEVVVSLGPQCHLLCLSRLDGAYRWGISLTENYGTKVPLWYTGQCPLIDQGELILAPAGTNVLMCGMDLKTGKTTFETSNPKGWNMSHSSIMVMTVDGVRQYVYAALGGIVGVAAEGEKRGQLLWQTSAFAPSVVAPSPVPLPHGRFFMTAGYGSGGAMFQIARDATGIWQATVLFKTDKKQFACEQQTPIFRDQLLYTVMPSDGGADRQQLVCMTPEGQRCWASGKDDIFGLGPYLATPDGLLFLLDDVGTLTLARADRTGYRRLARCPLMRNQGRDAWGPLVLVNGRLFLRDSHHLYCLEVGTRIP